ncbi:hypothetical protein F7734_54565 [Scytonema sp. UIC 10036]|uniref:hypothetical protein n=1 Tax=Scytonema sp. UIC 10036 TaxID=2304196 RepID=UPI0012DA1A4C|nr:hypothetical protein [Scytonema sp. UIC 10036]MUH00823.1 hypothetical protein [Scytonema sp. UIC 10036]
MNRRMLEDVTIPDLIDHLRCDVAERLIRILVAQGLSLEILLRGLAGYCHSRGLEGVCRRLEQAIDEASINDS